MRLKNTTASQDQAIEAASDHFDGLLEIIEQLDQAVTEANKEIERLKSELEARPQ